MAKFLNTRKAVSELKDLVRNADQKLILIYGNGFCIRTGVSIPFNIEKPLSKEAYKKWNEYADETYPEKYCHFSGEPSNGETSVTQPILKKNWKKANERFSM